MVSPKARCAVALYESIEAFVAAERVSQIQFQVQVEERVSRITSLYRGLPHQREMAQCSGRVATLPNAVKLNITGSEERAITLNACSQVKIVADQRDGFVCDLLRFRESSAVQVSPGE